ncbi:MAG: hypothetical protein KY468_18510 [Armatimonadetes bacterium]|nr:hypothetical protein [Armatimonadota bacterium]
MTRRPTYPTLTLRLAWAEATLLLKEEERRTALLDLFRRLPIRKVTLDLTKATEPDESGLPELRSFFNHAGLVAAACISVPLPDPESSSDGLCYTRPGLQRAMEREIQRAAAFDEIWVEGLNLSGCTCESCRKEKGRRSWSDFRRSSLLSFAKGHLIEPARRTHPGITLTLLLPGDHESLKANSYPIAPLSQSFHRMLVGRTSLTSIEAAGTHGNGLPWPGSPFFFRWLLEIAGRKAAGGEIILPQGRPEAFGASGHASDAPRNKAPAESLLMPSPAEQAVAWTLAGATELCLRSSGDLLSSPSLPALEAQIHWLPEIQKVARRTPLRGIAAYCPPNADPHDDAYLFEALSRWGFPLRPTPRFPSSSRVAFFTRHAGSDRDLPEKLAEFIKEGIACITPSLRDTLHADGPALPEGERLRIWPDALPPGSGEPRLSMEAIPSYRDFLLDPLGVRFIGPTGVTLHLFGPRDVALQNFNDSPATLRLEIPGKLLRIIASSDESLEAGTELVNGGVTLGAHHWLHLST